MRIVGTSVRALLVINVALGCDFLIFPIPVVINGFDLVIRTIICIFYLLSCYILWGWYKMRSGRFFMTATLLFSIGLQLVVSYVVFSYSIRPYVGYDITLLILVVQLPLIAIVVGNWIREKLKV
jgi:uncharacterized membrane protein